MNGLERWRGRCALITGASSGIGEALARRLARQGILVALSARRADRLEALAEEIVAGGGQALAIPADMRSEESILAMFRSLGDAWGGLDVLINNAGIGYGTPLSAGIAEEWREMLEVNVLALAICMREAVREMRGKPEGLIVNLGSRAARQIPADSHLAFYAATKHAVLALTEGMSAELALENSPIRIAMISPGRTETEFYERLMGDAQRAQQAYNSFRPLRAAEVADAICWILGTAPNLAIDDMLFRSFGPSDAPNETPARQS